MHSAAEWVASIPEQITATDALRFIDVALLDAKQAAADIADKFEGTKPPPPWPMHAELQTVVAAMEGGKLQLQSIIEAGHGDVARDRANPQVVRLMAGGRALYAEVAKMQERMRGVKVEDLPALAAAAVKRVAANKLGGWATLAVLLWALNEFSDGD